MAWQCDSVPSFPGPSRASKLAGILAIASTRLAVVAEGAPYRAWLPHWLGLRRPKARLPGEALVGPGVPVKRRCSNCRLVFKRDELNGKPIAKGYARYQCPRCGEMVFVGDQV